LKLNQHLITCAPTLLMQYCEHYLDEILTHTLPQVRDVVKKRQQIARYMDSIGLQYLPGASTFYLFVDIRKSGLNSTEFSETLLEEDAIAVVPGIHYGKSTDQFIRIGVGTESEERIRNALLKVRSRLG
jgi:aspartate/methionine/tyrosine aminotransferase